MNRRSRACAVVLLVACAPVALAQKPATQQAPARSAPNEQAQDEQAQRTSESAVEAIRNFSVERRAEAIASAKRADAELDRQMDRLQEQVNAGWHRMSRATRDQSQRAMAGLRQRRTAVAEWYGGMQHGSAGAWVEVRTGFVKSYHELADALHKARMEFKQEQAPPTDRDAKQP